MPGCFLAVKLNKPPLEGKLASNQVYRNVIHHLCRPYSSAETKEAADGARWTRQEELQQEGIWY